MSDLHFGRTNPDLLGPLKAAVAKAAADLIVISGDFTQRARRWQYRAARDFVSSLPGPVLAVPGNHDVPLENPAIRMLQPFRRYRRYINSDTAPQVADDEMVVIGLNTVDPSSWQRGRISGSQVRRVRDVFGGHAMHKARVVVMHHPLEHAIHDKKSLMHGAQVALDAFIESGVDVILSGHLHTWRVEPFGPRGRHHLPLMVQVGTGLSTRLRGEDNDFNLLTIEPSFVRVERFVAVHGTGFERRAEVRFERQNRIG